MFPFAEGAGEEVFVAVDVPGVVDPGLEVRELDAALFAFSRNQFVAQLV